MVCRGGLGAGRRPGHCSLIWATDVLRAFRRRNPGALVLCHFNTSDVNASWIKDPYYARLWNDTNPHEDWFHHDADGQRVRIYYPKYRERFAFNTGNSGLQQYLARRIVETLRPILFCCYSSSATADSVRSDSRCHFRSPTSILKSVQPPVIRSTRTTTDWAAVR